MTGFDWPALMRAGIRGLGLQPGEFWCLTPSELVLMLGEAGGFVPLSRSRLAELEAAYPDVKKEDQNG